MHKRGQHGYMRLLLALAWFASGTVSAATEQPDKRPDIVLIVSDDGGYADFGFNGCKDFRTPALDKLASQGIVFRNAYVCASVCSPSRAGLLTGRHPARIGHEFNPPQGRGDTGGLPLPEKTLADYLQQAGYTTAAFGKWHLGTAQGMTPNERGFGHFYGFLGGSHDYLPAAGRRPKQQSMTLNGVEEPLGEYITDAISTRAADYIGNQPKNKPLFLYVAFNCPHSPMQAKPGTESRFSSIEDGQRRTLAAMQASLDEGVARIAKALQQRGKLDNTILWFINDNGAGTYWNFDNGGLRNRKGSLFDGGIKVASFVRWPQGIRQPGIQQSPVSSLDIAATVLAAAGVPPSSLHGAQDGISLLPHWRGEAAAPQPRTLYWRQGRIGAIRRGDAKLLLIDEQPALLFDLKTDPNETTDLLPRHKELAASLAADFTRWNRLNKETAWAPTSQPGVRQYDPASPRDAWKQRAARETSSAHDGE